MAWLDLYLCQDTTSLERLIGALSEAIKACSTQIEDAEKSGDNDYLDHVVDGECGVIEDLIGTAFVGCQIYITATVSGTKHFHDLSLEEAAHKKAAVLSVGSPILSPTKYTRVQVIDAFANYYKHKDEWGYAWADLKGRAAYVVPIIQAAGASEGSTGNFRTAAKALGISDIRNLEILHRDIQEWCDNVWNIYRLKMNAAHKDENGESTIDASN